MSAKLTPRQMQMILCVARGMQNKAIAEHLGVALQTVQSHLTTAYRKIGVRDRTQAAMWVYRNGILDAWESEKPSSAIPPSNQ